MPPGSLEEEPQDFNEAALSWGNKYAMAVKRACYWGHALYYNPIPLERANSRPLSDAAHTGLCKSPLAALQIPLTGEIISIWWIRKYSLDYLPSSTEYLIMIGQLRN